jgi:hypothetical protein
MARRGGRGGGAQSRFAAFSGPRLLLSLVVILLLALAAASQFAPIPLVRQGPQCTDLAPPIGGNNRSVLAQSGGDPQNLDLDLWLTSAVVATDQTLEVHVTFNNSDNGPVILYLTDTTPPITRLDNDTGLSFEIRRVGTDQIVSDGAAPRPAPQSYPRDQLHLLGAGARCTQTYRYSVQQLSALGLQPGEYRIRAFYSNSSSGVLPPPESGLPPTATPAYSDQGVWVGSTSSEEVLFTVVAPGAAAPVG